MSASIYSIFPKHAVPFVCKSCRSTTGRSPLNLRARQLQSVSLSTLRSSKPRIQSLRNGSSILSKTQQRQISIFDARTKQYWGAISRQHPIMLPAAVALIGVLGVTLVVYIYGAFRIRYEMSNYPEEVDLLIRQGVKFTDNRNMDGDKALNAWNKALNLAIKKYEMHPLSEEVVFIYLRFAHCLEKFGLFPHAIELLEDHKKLCMRAVQEDFKDKPELSGERTRILETAVKISAQLGGLYAKPAIDNLQKSEDNLVWATETTLKEMSRRGKEGVKQGEGEWLDADQIGAIFEALGAHYEQTDQHYFASQLFLRALSQKTTQDCHTVTLMGNIAAAISQSVPPVERGVPPASRDQLYDSSVSWAKKAVEIARSIKPPTRTEECDVGCAVAVQNLGNLAEMMGNMNEAREKYEEAMSLFHAIGLEPGMKEAEDGLKRVSGGSKTVQKAPWFSDEKGKERSRWY